MTVGELREALSEYDDDEVVYLNFGGARSPVGHIGESPDGAPAFDREE
jgi:hypothetical protein